MGASLSYAKDYLQKFLELSDRVEHGERVDSERAELIRHIQEHAAAASRELGADQLIIDVARALQNHGASTSGAGSDFLRRTAEMLRVPQP